MQDGQENLPQEAEITSITLFGWLAGWLLVATVRVLEKDQTIIFLQVLQQYAASILRYNQEILASFLLKHKSAGYWKIIPNIHQCKYPKVWQSLNNNFIILSCQLCIFFSNRLFFFFFCSSIGNLSQIVKGRDLSKLPHKGI